MLDGGEARAQFREALLAEFGGTPDEIGVHFVEHLLVLRRLCRTELLHGIARFADLILAFAGIARFHGFADVDDVSVGGDRGGKIRALVIAAGADEGLPLRRFGEGRERRCDFRRRLAVLDSVVESRLLVGDGLA